MHKMKQSKAKYTRIPDLQGSPNVGYVHWRYRGFVMIEKDTLHNRDALSLQ